MQNNAPHTNNEDTKEKKTRLRLSRDPNKAMQEMMFTIDRLRTSLLQETSALKDADTQSFLAMQDNKLDIARDYLEGMNQLISRKDELKNADEQLKDRLEEMRIDFGNIAHDNHAALSRMKNGMKRLGDRIMEAARETARKEKQFVYGANGHLQESTSGTIGINESA